MLPTLRLRRYYLTLLSWKPKGQRPYVMCEGGPHPELKCVSFLSDMLPANPCGWWRGGHEPFQKEQARRATQEWCGSVRDKVPRSLVYIWDWH